MRGVLCWCAPASSLKPTPADVVAFTVRSLPFPLQNTGQTKLSDTFVGKVVEVVSGDTLVVKDINAGGAERRISLSR